MKYLLFTAAYNEEKYIGGTIESVIKQTFQPVQWIIISDGSTDTTDEIIKSYQNNIPYITFIHYKNTSEIESNLGKVSKRIAACISEGLKYVDKEYDFIGNLDADVTFDKNYFKDLLAKFNENDNLGLGGGFIYNFNGEIKWPYFTKPEQVGGPVQFFRKKCWEQIGGYYPGGHHDYFAVVNCRKLGWTVQSFSELEVLHHKNPLVVGRNLLHVNFHLGRMDYVCGEVFIYALARSIIMITEKPVFIGSILRIGGYIFSKIMKTKKQVPPSIAGYLVKEQYKKILPKFIFTFFNTFI